MSSTNGASTDTPSLDVAIIGTGFGGLCMAIKLKMAGITNFVLLEKADSLGGTWRDNTYPGAACDVPSFLYSYSFEPKKDWSHAFAPQDEILGYMEHCSAKYGITPHIRFNTEVTNATFDADGGVWRIETKSGDGYIARSLVAATGQLNRPAYPPVPGREDFQGVQFHSARWNHDYDLEGKTVAVIGTGASAIQFVPEIAPKVEKLLIFQRNPNWIFPKMDKEFTQRELAIFEKVPFAARAKRWLTYFRLESRWPAFIPKPAASKQARKMALENLAAQLPDKALRKISTPDYEVGCKRMLITNHWYPALRRDNVEIITDAVDTFTAGGVHTAAGTDYPVDAIIYGTGFESTKFLEPIRVEGLDGALLGERWKGGAEAYYGVAVSGFPNFYILYGPNTNLAHNSIIFMMECQVRYIMQCLGKVNDGGAKYLNLREDVMQEYNVEMQSKLKERVWATGCTSWYTTDEGKNTNNWPYSTIQYWHRTRRPDFTAFELAR